ncbi:unnamed protein product [Blepharisma stoltei]|uniref:FCP1 homology domain-containing protein n=1 Tax=Blepharisma stoltei TaxID=1481888 RepID=A0AAU9JFP1_9CILI|nr:unnamed protein product [Blepharisma stoltei]
MAIRIPTRPHPPFASKTSNSNLNLTGKSQALNPFIFEDKTAKSTTLLPSINSFNINSLRKIRKTKKAHTLKLERFSDPLQNSPSLNSIVIQKSGGSFSRSMHFKLTADPLNSSPLFDDLYEEEKEIITPTPFNEVVEEDLQKSIFRSQSIDVDNSQTSFWHKISENTKKPETPELTQIKKPQGLKIRVVKSSQGLPSSRSIENPQNSPKLLSLKITKSSDPKREEPKGSEKWKKSMKDHLFQTFQALKYLNSHPSIDIDLVRCRKIKLTKKLEFRKTVIFDLDETLIHCVDNEADEASDAIIPVKFPNGMIAKTKIKIRPYAVECLRVISKICEVIIFSSFNQTYADAIIDFLDPKKEIVHHRLYRDSCVIVNGLIIKDIRILEDRNLEDVVIVDNSVHSFIYQLENGIPIVSWTNNEDDKELLNLVNYIKKLTTPDDIRKLNRKTFKLYRFYMDYIHEFETDSPHKAKK